ncbi:MAG: DUF882 domain-containing protein [Kiloniellales bacterium]
MTETSPPIPDCCAVTSEDRSRRDVVAGLAGAAALSLFGGATLTPTAARAGEPRALAFRNLHTGETLETIYWADGSYRHDGLEQINHILRDWRTGDLEQMDPALLDLLHSLQATLDARGPFHVISAYRSPKTNAALASKSNGVARKSFHMRGMAIDIALPDRDLTALRDAAWRLQRGGVGYYAKSGFIHVDTGRVRRWNF